MVGGDLDTDDETNIRHIGSVSKGGDKWGWYRWCYTITKGDILKFDGVLRMGVIEIFNFMAYRAENKITD